MITSTPRATTALPGIAPFAVCSRGARAVARPASLLAMAFAFTAMLAASGCKGAPANVAGPGDEHVGIAGLVASSPTKATPDEALTRLREGNARFAAGKGGSEAAKLRDLSRVHATGTEGQRPFAAVLTCADSRLPPEVVFDQGIGNLFVVRVAGNVTDTMGLASLEYGVDHLGVPLIVVLGHTRCGAVDAAVASATHSARPDDHHAPGDHGNLEALVHAIEPAVRVAQHEGGQPLLDAAIRANVRQSIAQLSSRSQVLAREIGAGDIRVVGAIYNVETGAIEWMDQPR